VAGCARAERGGGGWVWDACEVGGAAPARRADNQRNSAALTALRGRAEAAEAALEPLRARGREAAAQAESHAEEVKAVRAPPPARCHHASHCRV